MSAAIPARIDRIAIRRALISVSDKSGLIELGQALAKAGVEILSTGGTAKALAAAGIATVEVADYTGFPEMLDGRVKTLHPKIHGGLLGRRDLPSHQVAMEAHDIGPIDLVVVNLYPFEATIADPQVAFDHAIENIDIGGPSMLRSAAKNHDFVAVVTDPADYPAVISALQDGGTDLALRRELAARTFARTAAYDAAIAAWLAPRCGVTLSHDAPPRHFTLGGTLRQALRYGENPHQMAAFYAGGAARPGVATARQMQGKELSYNNLNDTDAAFELVAEFSDPAVAIIKHASPCGVAIGATLEAAYDRALACDPISAFGGIIALNRPLDAATATKIGELFAEVVIAPEISDDALAILAKKTNLRVLATGAMPDPTEPGVTVKTLAGGFLVQSRDIGAVADTDLAIATRRPPTEAERRDLRFAWTVVKHVKSNAIVIAKDGATVGIGGGQTSRVDSAKHAASQAGDRAQGAVVASDAFFPFPDGLEVCLAAGVCAVIQPGGAKGDAKVIDAADQAGAAMLLTGMRHFRH